MAPTMHKSGEITPSSPWDRAGRAPLTAGWWVRGLWLAERVEAAGQPPELPDGAPEEGGLGWRAARRLERWRSAFPELAEDTAEVQACALGVDTLVLHRLLAESPDSLAARAVKPEWADFVERVIAQAAATSAQDTSTAGDDEDDATREHHHNHESAWFRGFAAVVEPFVAEARRMLRTCPALTGPAGRAVLDADALIDAFTHSLRSHLVQLLARVLVLELNVSRLSGRLDGETPEDRFRSFVTWQCAPENLAALLDEYAAPTRLLASVSVNTAHAYAEFAERFVQDRPVLVERMFGGEDPGMLAEVRMGEGDMHEACRSVAVVRFASGARLVYKPRPLAIHEHFNEVVGWLNAALPDLDLRTVAVLDLGGHGWIEFVEPEPCRDRAGAARFYHRQGALLALLYALAAVDFHFENVIAVGDQPVVVDLESLFHVDVPPLTGSPLIDHDPARTMLDRSVQRVGLLPSILVGDGGSVIDLGGMGADKGSVMPFKSAAWNSGGTDEMRLARVHHTFAGSRNRPSLDGRDLDPAEHLGALCAGFRAAYRVIADGREHFLAAGGLLDRFTTDTGRVIVRATQTYAQLLQESTHPDVARDALDRDRVLGLLFAQSAETPSHAGLLREEAADLWAGDVPLFRTRVGSRDLHTHRGTVLRGALAESGLERSRRTVDGMGESDLAVQDWIIRAAFAARAADPGTGGSTVRTAPDDGSSAIDDDDHAERALQQARLIADRLTADRLDKGRRVGWLGLDLAEDQWRVAVLRDDLYGGYVGLALFFAQLARVTGEERHADAARRILAPIPAHLATVVRRRLKRNWGAFGGLAGTAYALDGVAASLADRSLAAPVPDLLALAAQEIEEDEQHDLIGGAAGCLAVAEALVPRYGAAAESLAERCAALLVDRAEVQQDGPEGAVAWRGTIGADRPLLGSSHGAGGIGWALLRHAARTGAAAALRVGRGALDYENAAFEPSVENWPDHRTQTPRPWRPAPPPGTVLHLHAWCHGAPGIGLLRADLPAALRTPDDDRALRRAVRSTAAVGGSGNDSICHGDLGNLELFAAAARAGSPEAAEQSRRFRASILRGIERRGPICGTPGGIGTPGLLAGLSGIGHGLLRIADPDLVAPVLLLAPHGSP